MKLHLPTLANVYQWVLLDGLALVLLGIGIASHLVGSVLLGIIAVVFLGSLLVTLSVMLFQRYVGLLMYTILILEGALTTMFGLLCLRP